MSPRQAKRPVGRTVEMYLDVLSKVTDFYLNNNLTESVSTMICSSPMPATVSKPIPRIFSPILFLLLLRPLFMRMLLKIQICNACFFFPIWPPVAVNNIHYFLVRVIIDGLGGAIIIVETLY